MASTLFSVAVAPLAMDGLVRVDDGEAGVVVLHAAPGIEPPEDATILMDGALPWTWGEFAEAYPTLASHCMPNEWLGTPSAHDATVDAFPRLAGDV